MNKRIVQFAVCFSIVALIGSQIPMSGQTAMADGYTIGGDSAVTGAQTVTEAGVGALALYGLYSVVTTPAAAGGAGALGAAGAAAAFIPSDYPIYDAVAKDNDLTIFTHDAQDLMANNQRLGPDDSKVVFRAADNNQKRYTVFAPIDSAFTSLSSGTIVDLLNPRMHANINVQQTRDTMAQVFAYHIFPGRALTINALKQLPGATSSAGAMLSTLDSTPIYIHYTPGVSGDPGLLQVSTAAFDESGAHSIATIRQTDERASNGVVHPIDTVLVPPELATTPLHINGSGTPVTAP